MNFAPGEIAQARPRAPGRLELEADEADLPAGTPVTLAIRPEDIIAPAEAAPADERIGGNIVSATLGDFEFLGYFVRADLKLPGLAPGCAAPISRTTASGDWACTRRQEVQVACRRCGACDVFPRTGAA